MTLNSPKFFLSALLLITSFTFNFGQPVSSATYIQSVNTNLGLIWKPGKAIIRRTRSEVVLKVQFHFICGTLISAVICGTKRLHTVLTSITLC